MRIAAGTQARGLRALDRQRNLCDSGPMPKALEEVTKEALELPPRQRLALAGLLLESAEATADPEAESAWDAEIRDRIRTIDEGRVSGVAYEDVMRAAEGRLAP
jgi:putative addiction module component (TIGR02574 family)